MDKNLPTHLFRPVDEIVRLVPIPGINISFAFIKIIEIISCPDDQIFQATVDEALFEDHEFDENSFAIYNQSQSDQRLTLADLSLPHPTP